MSRLLPTAFVLIVWLALWGEVSVVNVASGVLVVVIMALLFRPMPRRHTLHPLALTRLLLIFAWRLLSSSASVVWTVLSPTPERLRSGVVGVALSQRSPLVATIVADAISLTPGTLTLEVRYDDGDAGTTADTVDVGETPDGPPPVLYIHVLGLSDPAAIRDDVQRLERLVVSAVTPYPTDSVSRPADADTASGGPS